MILPNKSSGLWLAGVSTLKMFLINQKMGRKTFQLFHQIKAEKLASAEPSPRQYDKILLQTKSIGKCPFQFVGLPFIQPGPRRAARSDLHFSWHIGLKLLCSIPFDSQNQCGLSRDPDPAAIVTAPLPSSPVLNSRRLYVLLFVHGIIFNQPHLSSMRILPFHLKQGELLKPIDTSPRG